jgi:branched-chain amino acid transport system permease protein
MAFRPFRRFRDEASLKSKAMREATLLSSLAVSIIVREALELRFSGEMQTIAQRYLLQTPIQFGPVTITDGNLIIFGLSALSLLALQFVLYRTRIGMGIRAVSSNVLGAQFVGIDTTRAIVATFVVGSVLGAIAGIMVGLYQGAIFPHMGFEPGVKAFVAMVMGGLSSIPGAVACALLLGVSESVATQFFSDGWKALVSYSFLLLTLWFFPNGIFGTQKEKM